MKHLWILILPLFLAGCSPIISNDQIIKETKKCNEAGLNADTTWGSETFFGDGGITGIICIPIRK